MACSKGFKVVPILKLDITKNASAKIPMNTNHSQTHKQTLTFLYNGINSRNWWLLPSWSKIIKVSWKKTLNLENGTSTLNIAVFAFPKKKATSNKSKTLVLLSNPVSNASMKTVSKRYQYPPNLTDSLPKKAKWQLLQHDKMNLEKIAEGL